MMGALSATSSRVTLAVLVRESGWWLRAVVCAPVTFPRFSLLAGLALLVASVAGHTSLALLASGLLGVAGIGVAAFFCFIFSWVEVVFARILTVTGGKPITMAIQAMFTFQTNIGMVMAMTCLSLLPGVAMIWFVRNHIARGFTLRA